jgi:hypothetical protein
MAPDLDPGFLARAAALCAFRATGEVLPARKSQLALGEVAGRSAIAKRVARAADGAVNAVWAWYFAREVAIYRVFAARPPPVRVPELFGADDDVLVIERLPGAPLARRRRPHAELSRDRVAALLEMRRSFAAYPDDLPSTPPPPRVRSQLRARLLEDPTAPLAWITDGLTRAATRGWLDDAHARDAREAIAAYPAVAPSHGDLLLRNVIEDAGSIGLVDWECAGGHAADWDLALLYTQLAPAARAPIDEAIGTGVRARAFAALTVFAFARELAFLDAFRAASDDPARLGVAREIDDMAARLRA